MPQESINLMSVESVLNSRCSSDFGDREPKRHWGTYGESRPNNDEIKELIDYIQIPRISKENLVFWFENGFIYLGFEDPNDLDQIRILNIESGMQHQALYLGCVIRGLGTCIHNEGIEGTKYEEKMCTGKHLIMQMSEPYESGKLTKDVPGPNSTFTPGKYLNAPIRTGKMECLPQFKKLQLSNNGGKKSTINEISQLLWAAKGRTPHLIRPHVWRNMWGLTIPTWGGGQNYTNVYGIIGKKLFRYKNWTVTNSITNKLFLNFAHFMRGNPTHDIESMSKTLPNSLFLDGYENAILLCRNEQTNRSLWEVGYMLENLLLQCRSLDITYSLKILKKEDTACLEKLCSSEPVAMLFL